MTTAAGPAVIERRRRRRRRHSKGEGKGKGKRRICREGQRAESVAPPLKDGEMKIQ